MREFVKYTVFGMVYLDQRGATVFLHKVDYEEKPPRVKRKASGQYFRKPITPGVLPAESITIYVCVDAVETRPGAPLRGRIRLFSSDMKRFESTPELKRVWKEVTQGIDDWWIGPADSFKD
jgi:hypothetical protein